MSFIPSGDFGASSFSLFQRSMMQQEDLPLADALDDARWEEALAEHQVGRRKGVRNEWHCRLAGKDLARVLPISGRR